MARPIYQDKKVAVAAAPIRRNVEFGLIVLLALYSLYYFRTANAPHLIRFITVGVHESGHLITRPFGELINVAGGTFFQLFVPVAAFVNFWRLKQKFVAAAMLMWLAINFFDVALYAGDAIDMALPLVTVGGTGENIIHDWNFMLTAAGLLPHAVAIARFIDFLGFAAIAAGLYLAWRSRTAPMPEI